MGHDIRIICNHKLQTETSLTLGQQISEIFCVPIEVYVRRFYKIKSVLDISFFNDEYDVLGTFDTNNVIKNKDVEKLQLTDGSISDESIECLEAYKLYGTELLKTKDGKSLFSDATKVYKDSPWYEIYIKSINKEETYIDWDIDMGVHHYVATPHIYFNPRWWSFSNIFFKRTYRNSTIEEIEDSYRFLIRYRKRIKTIVKIIGGTEAYYFSDQDKAAGIDDYAIHHTWQETKAHILETFGNDMISISEYILNNNIKDKEDYYPKVYYDDFKDLD